MTFNCLMLVEMRIDDSHVIRHQMGHHSLGGRLQQVANSHIAGQIVLEEPLLGQSTSNKGIVIKIHKLVTQIFNAV